MTRAMGRRCDLAILCTFRASETAVIQLPCTDAIHEHDAIWGKGYFPTLTQSLPFPLRVPPY